MTELTDAEKAEKEVDKGALKVIAMNLIESIDDVKDINSKVAIASAFNILMDISKGL